MTVALLGPRLLRQGCGPVDKVASSIHHRDIETLRLEMPRTRCATPSGAGMQPLAAARTTSKLHRLSVNCSIAASHQRLVPTSHSDLLLALASWVGKFPAIVARALFASALEFSCPMIMRCARDWSLRRNHFGICGHSWPMTLPFYNRDELPHRRPSHPCTTQCSRSTGSKSLCSRAELGNLATHHDSRVTRSTFLPKSLLRNSTEAPGHCPWPDQKPFADAGTKRQPDSGSAT